MNRPIDFTPNSDTLLIMLLISLIDVEFLSVNLLTDAFFTEKKNEIDTNMVAANPKSTQNIHKYIRLYLYDLLLLNKHEVAILKIDS